MQTRTAEESFVSCHGLTLVSSQSQTSSGRDLSRVIADEDALAFTRLDLP